MKCQEVYFDCSLDLKQHIQETSKIFQDPLTRENMQQDSFISMHLKVSKLVSLTQMSSLFCFWVCGVAEIYQLRSFKAMLPAPAAIIPALLRVLNSKFGLEND